MDGRAGPRGAAAHVPIATSRIPLASALVLAALLVGAWARLHGLGASSLAVDEYYLGTSVRNVLEHGVPRFDCGGFYTRGLLHQYVSAALLAMGAGSLEFAIRLPSVAADSLSILGAWLLARHLGGRSIALLVVALLGLSLWQIEFARFGRMYAVFQACTVFYALAAVRFLEKGEGRHYWQMIGIAALGLVSHEGGALLAAFTLLAPLLAPRRVSAPSLLAAVALGAAVVALLTVELRFFGVGTPYARELLESAARPEGHPPIDLPVLPAPSSMLAAALLLGALGCTTLLLRSGALAHPLPAAGSPSLGRLLAALVWTAVLVSLALYQLAFAALLIACASLFRLIDLNALRRVQVLGLLVAFTLLAALVWSLHPAAPDAFTLLKAALRYPDFYLEVLTPWGWVLPLLGAAIAVVCILAGAFVLLRGSRTEPHERYRLLLGVTLVLLAAAVLSRQPYFSTRYTYFLYPLLLILLVQGLALLGCRFAPRVRPPIALPVAITGAVFLASNDFSLRHVISVDRPEYLYRTVYGQRLHEHFFRRWDYRSVAEVLNRQARPEDLVISTAYPVMPQYSSLLDAVYVDSSDPRIWIVSGCGGTRDLWSNLPLVFSPEALQARIAGSRVPVWLVLSTEKYRARSAVEASLLARYRGNEVFRSIDGHLALLRISPGVVR